MKRVISREKPFHAVFPTLAVVKPEYHDRHKGEKLYCAQLGGNEAQPVGEQRQALHLVSAAPDEDRGHDAEESIVGLKAGYHAEMKKRKIQQGQCDSRKAPYYPAGLTMAFDDIVQSELSRRKMW